MARRIDVNFEIFFPGYTKRAITFTMDDGNITFDKKFIDIVRPNGITGAFNLVGGERKGDMTDEEYREFYRGFEIMNHCKYHPKVLTAEWAEKIDDTPFDANTADKERLYPTGIDGIYYKNYGTWWGHAATDSAYIDAVIAGKSELEDIFGKGNIKGFVWPFCSQDSFEVVAHLVRNYSSVRRTGTADFDIPENLFDWCYNATHKNILERAEEFDSLPDDGTLKFFAFGVHPIDFERSGTWDALVAFAEKYGNRPEDFYYATPSEIFEYNDAANSLVVNDEGIYNPTNTTLYIKINEEKMTLGAGERHIFA